MDILSFKEEIKEHGWCKIPKQLSHNKVNRLNFDLQKAQLICRQLQIKNNLSQTDGSVHHLIGMGQSFIDFLDPIPVFNLIFEYFGRNFILNSFGGVINLPNKGTYTSIPHRDQRTFSADQPNMLNLLLMLDEFTLENGATHLLSGSHRLDSPVDVNFFNKSDRAVGNEGDILLFNSNLWHATGANRTEVPRRALTLTFTPPWFKQQMDYPRLLGNNQLPLLNENLKQILGFNSRVPANLEEWYQPPENRMYKRDQG